MQRFYFSETDEYCWQVMIRTFNQEIASELYPEEWLQNPNKLKNTLLGRYSNIVERDKNTAFWSWMAQRLMDWYENSTIIELPYLAGWFYIGEKWFFWTRKEENILLASEVVRKFTVKTFLTLNEDEVIDGIIRLTNCFGGQENLGIFLIFRGLALLSRFVTDSSLQISLTIVGDGAIEVAEACLRTMDSEDTNCDIINLDGDRMDSIQKSVKELQDTSIIIASSDADNKSTMNRFQKIRGWRVTFHGVRK